MRLKPDSVVWSEVNDEFVCLDLGRSEYFTANETATVLIKRLSEADATLDELRDDLVARFQVDPARAAEGVDRLVGLLRSRDLLED